MSPEWFMCTKCRKVLEWDPKMSDMPLCTCGVTVWQPIEIFLRGTLDDERHRAFAKAYEALKLQVKRILAQNVVGEGPWRDKLAHLFDEEAKDESTKPG